MKEQEFELQIAGCDNIIFDYGGIFVDIIHQDTIQALQNLASEGKANTLYNKHSQSELFSLLETGKISPEKFLEGIKDELGIEADENEVVRAWCAMLKGHPAARVSYLRKLCSRKRCFMLSNINQIHEDFLKEIVLGDEQIKDFYGCFEKVYFSHKIGLRKPEQAAFELVLSENGLVPEKTAFIDDTIGHVEAARKLGIKGILLDPANCFIA